MHISDYQEWRSPITAEAVAVGSVSISQLEMDGDVLYFDETRPSNEGRTTLVFVNKDGAFTDATPDDFNCRSAVHEYGGGAFTTHEGTIYAANFKDKNLYVKPPGGEWRLLTTGCRFADMHVTQHGIIAVAEKHEEGQEVENFLALIDIETGAYRKLATGYDFYGSPAVSSDGTKIAWICWNHPNMPWYHTELWVAEISKEGELLDQRRVAGDVPEAIFQPQWSKGSTPKEILYFVSDRDEWWNLYTLSGDQVVKVFSLEGEMGVPNWTFRNSTWCFLGEDILFTYYSQGRWCLCKLDLKTKKMQQIVTDGISFRQLREGPGCAYYIEEFPTSPRKIVKIDALTLEKKVVREEVSPFSVENLSSPQHVEYPSAEGRKSYGYYYPPKNGSFKAPEGKKPPLLVMIHGGPHGCASPTFSLAKQFWTSHGFAVLDVNYGGSTGYGRAYRFSLHGRWGIVDVEDCVYGARFLAEQGLVDPEALFIRGGSAGGFTTLAVLASGKLFKAGADYFGVADLMALAHDTHKFESRYLDSLLGELPLAESVWRERSPLSQIDHFNTPLIIFQGAEDKIVPLNQAEMIYQALKEKGVTTELHVYEGEQHGFRKKETIIDSLEKELSFYRKKV